MSDINGGFSPNANGSPIFPGTLFTGPVLAGNVVHSDGSGTLAGVGETNVGTANVGYCVMAQSAIITQVTPSQTTTIVIPAQSQILAIYLMVTVAWSTGTTTLGIGTTANASAFTTSTGVQGSTLGQVVVTPGTSLANQIVNWDNVGSTDVQVAVLSGGGAGNGVGNLTVVYLQGINSAS